MARSKGKSKRKAHQKKRKRYMKLREELQVAGEIATTPEGAIRDERVDPATQSEQRIPSLDRAAVTRGWAVPEHVKRQVIERLAEPFFEGLQTVEDKDGNQIIIPPDRYLLKENAKVLVAADRQQWERDAPEEAGKAAGANQAAVVDLKQLMEMAAEQRRRAAELSAVNLLPVETKPIDAEPSQNGTAK